MRPTPIIPKPGQESVWDYPRPPRLEPCRLPLAVVVNGVTVAETTNGLRMLETSHPPTYYFPPADVRLELFTPAAGGSFCEYKGRAKYWSVTADGVAVANFAWSYPDPTAEYAALNGHFAFYCALAECCTVGGETARPQPGGFYGGWVTDSCAGPFKGGPGSMGW